MTSARVARARGLVLGLVLGLAAACASGEPAPADGAAGGDPAQAYVHVVDGAGTRSRVPYLDPADGRPLSLARLIAIRGGFAAGEDPSKVRITRLRAEGRTSTSLDWNDIAGGRRPDFLLRPDDVITIGPARR